MPWFLGPKQPLLWRLQCSWGGGGSAAQMHLKGVLPAPWTPVLTPEGQNSFDAPWKAPEGETTVVTKSCLKYGPQEFAVINSFLFLIIYLIF